MISNGRSSLECDWNRIVTDMVWLWILHVPEVSASERRSVGDVANAAPTNQCISLVSRKKIREVEASAAGRLAASSAAGSRHLHVFKKENYFRWCRRLEFNLHTAPINTARPSPFILKNYWLFGDPAGRPLRGEPVRETSTERLCAF